MIVNREAVERKVREAIKDIQDARRMMMQINDEESNNDAGQDRSFTANHFNVIEAADASLTNVDLVFFQ